MNRAVHQSIAVIADTQGSNTVTRAAKPATILKPAATRETCPTERGGGLHYLTEEFLKYVMNLELPPEKDGTSFRRYLAEDDGFD